MSPGLRQRDVRADLPTLCVGCAGMIYTEMKRGERAPTCTRITEARAELVCRLAQIIAV